MDIRIANETDLPELATLFRQTVLVNAPTYYTPDQTERWASSLLDTDHFRQFILEVTTFIATDDTSILGFAGLGQDGYVASAYVRHDSLHQGIGSLLMQTLLDHAQANDIGRLYAEASEFSLGLFRKFGFQLNGIEVITRQGVEFKRYLVELHL